MNTYKVTTHSAVSEVRGTKFGVDHIQCLTVTNADGVVVAAFASGAWHSIIMLDAVDEIASTTGAPP